MRRGATTEAHNQEVDTAVIEMNNHWRKVESKREESQFDTLTTLHRDQTGGQSATQIFRRFVMSKREKGE